MGIPENTEKCNKKQMGIKKTVQNAKFRDPRNKRVRGRTEETGDDRIEGVNNDGVQFLFFFVLSKRVLVVVLLLRVKREGDRCENWHGKLLR